MGNYRDVITRIEAFVGVGIVFLTHDACIIGNIDFRVKNGCSPGRGNPMQVGHGLLMLAYIIRIMKTWHNRIKTIEYTLNLKLIKVIKNITL